MAELFGTGGRRSLPHIHLMVNTSADHPKRSKTALRKRLFILSMCASFACSNVSAASDPQRPWFVGTSAFVAMNLLPDCPFSFGQLDLGYSLAEQDTIIAEALFWRYVSPVASSNVDEPAYAGEVYAYGLSFAYQRFLWKGLLVTGHVTPSLPTFVDEDRQVIQTGYQQWL